MNDTKTENSLKDFNDLEFGDHPSGSGGVRAYLEFGPVEKEGKNEGKHRYSISVVANKNGNGSYYGNVEDDEYEVAMYHHGAWIPLSVSDDVLGWQSPAQVSKHMRDAQLNDFAWVTLLHSLREDHRKELGLDT